MKKQFLALSSSPLGDLRYQLLTGVAGTLASAREIGGSRAVFVAHEFVTDQSRDGKQAQNASDLNRRSSNASAAV